MPTIPRLNGPSVRATPEPSRLRNAESYQPVNAQALGVAAEQVDRFAREVQRLDDVRISEALADYGTRLDGLLVDPRDGILNQRGTKAVNALDPFRDRMTTTRSEVGAGLNERQRALFEREAERFTRQADTRAMGHIGQETERVRTETFQNLLTRDLRTIAEAGTNTAMADETLRAVRERIAVYGSDTGMTPEKMQNMYAEAASQARVSQISTALAADDVDGATRLFDNYTADLTPDARADVQKLLRGETVRVRAQEGRDTILQQFRGDENGAIAEAKRQFKGEEEDLVVGYLRQHFRDVKVSQAEQLQSLSERAYNAVTGANGDITAISPRDLQALRTRHQRTFREIQSYATSLRNGTAIQTDLAVLDELRNLSNEELLTTNLDDYKASLDATHYDEIRKRKESLQRGTGDGSRSIGLTPKQIEAELFANAAGMGVFVSNAAAATELKKGQTDYGTFQRIVAATRANIEARRQKEGQPLTSTQMREEMNRVLDDVVFNYEGDDRMMPRAGLAPGAQTGTFLGGYRELTPAERAGLPRRGGTSTPTASAATDTLPTRALNRAKELVKTIRDEAEIERILRAEGLLPPTP